jgi:hypothetical protein
MGKMLAEFPELPWEMRLELAHQMWDEARHIEIVAKVVEDELGGELGYGPWSLVWWWMQNEDDPFRRLTVTNFWAERNLMRTLRQWRREASEQGMERIADLCDYLQRTSGCTCASPPTGSASSPGPRSRPSSCAGVATRSRGSRASTPATNQARPPPPTT